ncbi:hypothetical protein ATJ97_1436 [Georgenia soli]|uniref:DUF6286 domain-containing protein n=1 Tax=Georgenia soli TaxID=638953 RepID=A0A2A9EJ30_9MICO|nr:DUF6286 domain-containing protein [Georgenia soli]PFG38944.1 hypothetical protein ATJ97_1436 [Georgenia soli]
MSLLVRIVSVLLALVLFLGGLLAAAEIGLAQLRQPALLVPHRQWAAWLRVQVWESPTTRAVLAAMVLLGLLLVLVALRRGRPRTLALPPREGQTPAGVETHASRRSVERILAASTNRVSGVEGAAVAITRRRARVRASTPTRSEPELPTEVTETVTRELGELGLDRLRPAVSVTGKGRR